MNGVAETWKNIGLQLKLQILIQGSLILVLLAAQGAIADRFERQALKAAQSRAESIADAAINGLNTLMLVKVDEHEVISSKASRGLFIQKIGISEGLKELRVIRGKSIDDEFPPGLPEEAPQDELDHKVLDTGVTQTLLKRQGETGSLRTVMPFIAKTNFRTINCMQCHSANEGDVIGAASVTLDISDDLVNVEVIHSAMWVGQVILQILLFLIIRSIVRRLLTQLGGEPATVIEIVKRIATGDLSSDVITRPGDDNSLLAATKAMQEGLKHIITGTLRTSESLAQSANSMAASSLQVLRSAQNECQVSGSVAASVDEMTARIGAISESAVNAQHHTESTGSLAREGAGAVHQVIVEMDKLSEVVVESTRVITSLGEQSREISEIVNLIDEIADQTNLLALNAAIEAARAGEQGRGFAVVADEVRKLAGRTSASTQRIAAMVKAIQHGTDDAVKGMSKGSERVKEGVETAGRAGQCMEKIQQGVETVLTRVDEISSALREQALTSNEIAGSVEQIAKMTGETTSVANNVAVSADELERLSSSLREIVSKFKLRA